jgi:RecB family exonuclease
MSVRIALLHSFRKEKQREQLGSRLDVTMRKMRGLEQQCLLRLSEASLCTKNWQIALNAVTRAQAAEDAPSLSTSLAFSNVLWHMSERKTAIQALSEALSLEQNNESRSDAEEAIILARLVCPMFVNHSKFYQI